MLTTAPHNAHDITTETVVFMAFELRANTWKLGFSLGHGHRPRERPMASRDLKRLLDEVAHARTRCRQTDRGYVTQRSKNAGEKSIRGGLTTAAT